jgi:hypothetical protein
MKPPKFLVIILAVLYVILLPWPAWVILPYMFFSGGVKIAAILIAFAIELVLGVYLNILQYNHQKETKKTGARVLAIILALSYLIYAVSAIVYLVQVLASYF